MKTFTEWEATTDGYSNSEKNLMELAWNASAENSAEEIAKRDARIESLTAAGAEYQRQCFEQTAWIKELETNINAIARKQAQKMLDNGTYSDKINQQAAEISRLKGVLEKCKKALNRLLFHGNTEWATTPGEEALAAIKEEGL